MADLYIFKNPKAAEPARVQQKSAWCVLKLKVKAAAVKPHSEAQRLAQCTPSACSLLGLAETGTFLLGSAPTPFPIPTPTPPSC